MINNFAQLCKSDVQEFTMLKSLLDFIFPPRCLVCGINSEDVFCSKCLNNVSFLENITGAGKPFVYSAAIYEGAIRKALNLFKFKRKIKLRDSLSDLMIKCAEENKIITKNRVDLIIPVPVHKNVLKKRGYNQSELLAEKIADFYKIEINPRLLVKIKHTFEQNKLDKKDRLINLKGAFALNDKENIEESNILLIDDVYTTGATAKECVKTLKRNKGIKDIIILTLTRTI